MSEQTKYLLEESRLPRQWYNITADMPTPPAPVLHPQTLEPVTPDFLSVLFPMELILQEISTDRYIDIPEEVQEIYKLWRPTPMYRARRLEKALGTPAHIYYKYEGVSPVGSHKPNTAVPQAFYNKTAGVKALTTETGAGQWGSALAMACNYFNLDLEIFMVNISYQQKPYRRLVMETYGAEVFASPTERTQYGRSVLALTPDTPGSLGIAISEAVETAACPTLTKGSYTFDFGDTARMAPIVKMHTLGHSFIPPGIHAGGLRYHGMSPQISALVGGGYVEPRAINPLETFEAAVIFALSEGIIPAPEPTHAIAAAIQEAMKCKATGEQKVIAFNLSGHGHFDMTSYEAYFRGDLRDYDYPEAAINRAMADLPKVGPSTGAVAAGR